MSLKSNGKSLADPLKDMVSLDGTRTLSSFEHSLRAANKLAGDLVTKKGNGESLSPADVGRVPGEAPATPAKKTPATPRKRKSKFDYLGRENAVCD